MNYSDKISVVMATYNGEKYLREQLDSILMQSYHNIEVICVDDNSTDSTLQILIDYQNKYIDKIKLISQKQNTGSRIAFSNGCVAASGRYIAFADQDDWWFPQKLETLYKEIILNNNFAFVYSNSELVNEKLEQIQHRTFDSSTHFISGKNFYRILNENTIMGCAMLLSTDFVKKCLPFPVKGFHHDWYLAIMALGFDLEIKYIDQVLFKYRRHSANQVNKESAKKSQNTTRFRALRTYLENVFVDSSKFTNHIFKNIFESKKQLFHCIMHKQPIRAFFAWLKMYDLLKSVDCVNKKVKKSNFRYIFYSIGWQKISSEEKGLQ